MTKKEYKLENSKYRKDRREQKNEYRKKKGSELIFDDEWVFPMEIAKKAMGRGYWEYITRQDLDKLVLISAKSTKKSFCICLYILWCMVNFRGMNTLVMRNTVSTLSGSLINTFKQAINKLVDEYGLVCFKYLLNEGNKTRSNSNKSFEFPWQAEIQFRAFESVDNVAGIYPQKGTFELMFVDEPIVKNFTDEKGAFEKQQEDFKMIADSIFRGLSKFTNQVFKVDYDMRKQKVMYYFKRKTILTANPWNDKHWIVEQANAVIPDSEYQDFVLENIEKNIQMVRYVKSRSIDHLTGKQVISNTMFMKMSKFLNEFTTPQERAKDWTALQEGNPYDLTAILGFVYDGSDPTVYVYRGSVQNTKGFDKEINEFDEFSIGFDFGFSDRTSMTIKGMLRDKNNMLRTFTLLYWNFKNSKEKSLSRLQINNLVVEWVSNSFDIYPDMLDKKITFVCDEKGMWVAEMLQETLLAHGYTNFVFQQSVKAGLPIITRQIMTNTRLETGEMLVNWEEHKELKDEFYSIKYKEGNVERDEKHFPVDGINSFEYAEEPFVPFYDNFMDYANINGIKIGLKSMQKYV